MKADRPVAGPFQRNPGGEEPIDVVASFESVAVIDLPKEGQESRSKTVAGETGENPVVVDAIVRLLLVERE